MFFYTHGLGRRRKERTVSVFSNWGVPIIMAELSTLQTAPTDQPQGQTNKTSQFISDFGTQIAISIIIALVLFVGGFLGITRLAHYEDTIKDARDSLNKQLLEERKLAGTERENFRKEIDTRLKEIKDTIESVSEKYVAAAVGVRQEKIKRDIGELEKKTKARIKEIDEKLGPYRWLESRKDEVDSLVGIGSIGVAHSKMTELFRDKKPDMAIRVAKHALDSKISGDPDDFHNLAAELARQNLYSLASWVVLRGLEHFPQSV